MTRTKPNSFVKERLAVQGMNGEYGTLAQLRIKARRAAQTELLERPECGHLPHRDQPARLMTNVRAFIHRQTPENGARDGT
ncbi:alpha/beta fold hydrolase [Polaromonas sp. DSR2-3-2]|uniref:alpha/beta fold hydrolase n=1 Tax=Polaromonas sp. DSR2-3-2 TaxID=2804622 RepID=UPI003CF82A66